MAGGRVRAGRMRHRVILQNPVVTVGNFGADKITYEDAAEVWAEIKSQGSKESLIADQIVAVAKYEVKVRYIAGLTEQTRVKMGGNIYNVEAINQPDLVEKQMILTVSQDRSARGDGTI